MSCDHHSHKVKGRLRCCRCSAEHIIGSGWTDGISRPLKTTRCGEMHT